MSYASGVLKQSANYQDRQYMRSLTTFQDRFTAACSRARSILGDDYNAWVDASPAEWTALKFVEACEALPETGEALENWIAAMNDVDQIAETDNRPAMAAALTIENLARAALLAHKE
jgi:hypothetical protein